MNDLKVSAILPFKNAESFLPKALQQLDSIQFDSWEAVCIDDASTDSSYSILSEWAQTTNVNLRVIRNDVSKGCGGARNEGVKVASGEFSWFVDCDDEWSPEILSHLTSGLVDKTVDMTICDALRVYKDSKRTQLIRDAKFSDLSTGTDTLKKLLSGEVQGHLVNKLIRTSLLQTYPLPPMFAHEDLAGLIRMLPAVRKVAFVPGEKYRYLVHENSMLHSDEYTWTDLLKVVQIAEGVIRETGSNAELVQSLRSFKFSHVMIPAANDMVSKNSWDATQIPYVQDIELKDVVQAVRTGRPLTAVSYAVLAKAPAFYSPLRRLVGRG